MTYTLLPDYPVESVEWFAARAAGVSASDMQLLGRGTLSAFAEVKARKRGESVFRGNAFTEWGKEREPFLAAHAEFLYGVKATDRICVSDADPRWIASPDGISDTMLGEYKTTGTGWLEIPGHYRDQVLWAQFVTGVHQTAFVWEIREGSPGAFAPGAVESLVVEHDAERVAELIDIAERFWDYYQADQERGEFDDLIARYAIADAESKEKAAALAKIKAEIEARAGDRDLAVKSPLGSISYAFPKAAQRFDATAFKAAHPDTYAEFVTATPPTKKTLRVTTKD